MAIRCDDCRDLTLDSGVAWAVCRECVTSDGEPLAIFADRWRCAWAVVGEAVYCMRLMVEQERSIKAAETRITDLLDALRGDS